MPEINKIPTECPLLNKCDKLVSKGWYDKYCISKNWIHCVWVKKKPKEWKKEENKSSKNIDWSC